MKEEKVVLNVHAKDFLITCSPEFAGFLRAEIDRLSQGSGKIELRELVDAYLSNTYEILSLHKKLASLQERLDNFS